MVHNLVVIFGGRFLTLISLICTPLKEQVKICTGTLVLSLYVIVELRYKDAPPVKYHLGGHFQLAPFSLKFIDTKEQAKTCTGALVSSLDVL